MQACLRHPECETARENRDTVFLQMRRAMDLVHFVVKDGVIPELACAASSSSECRRKGARRGSWRLDEFDRCATVHNAVKMFEVGAPTTCTQPLQGYYL